ncbi:MAG: HlyD family secretion protein [Anaerolineae bacterium]
MRRRNIIIGIVVILAVVGYFGYSEFYTPSAAPAPTPELAEEINRVVWASGEVVPAQWADLSFGLGGQVVEIAVEEGSRVENGAILVRLDDVDLRHELAVTEASLAIAQAELDRLLAGARPEEVATARDNVSMAEAGLKAAEANLATAQAGVAAAQASVAGAQAELDRLLAGASAEALEAAAATMLKAEAALRQAQAEYDKIAWAGDVGTTPQALALESATLDAEVARANYTALVNGATPEEIAVAQAAIDAAEAQVQQAQAGVAQAGAQVEQARANLSTAINRLAVVQQGATEAEIAVAQANVDQARAAVAAAREALNKTTLKAPFEGTVGVLHARLGEQVLPGQPVLTLGDLSHLQVETTDLRETDVAYVSIGQPVDLTFDALPDALLAGHVVQIAPMASSGQGGTNYTTVVAFDELDPALRWGMTAFVNIAVER